MNLSNIIIVKLDLIATEMQINNNSERIQPFRRENRCDQRNTKHSFSLNTQPLELRTYLNSKAKI